MTKDKHRLQHNGLRLGSYNLIERLESRALFSAGPAITTQPVSKVFATQGDSATFTAAASGDPAPTVQWEVSVDGVIAFTPITDNPTATTDTLVLPNVGLNDEFNQYEAVFTNSVGTAGTNISTLYVNPPATPTLTTQPTNQNLAAPGDTATFTATASGDPAPTVQWYVEPQGGSSFTPITDNASATTTTLSLPDVGVSANGSQYEAVFTNLAGTVTTNAATLTVPAPSSAPATLSASLTAPPLKKTQKMYYFTVTYSGSTPIDTTSFDKHNVYVTGPDGYEEAATFIAFTPSNDGKTVSVTYRVSNSGSQWTASSNGKYHVYVRHDQIKDLNGDFVAGGILGPFKMTIA